MPGRLPATIAFDVFIPAAASANGAVARNLIRVAPSRLEKWLLRWR